MMPLALSVIIPTHKRPDILARTLEHLAKQTIASELEVIVVSDGRDEETRSKMQETNKGQIPIKIFEIEKSHQGVARNVGVQHTTAPLTLFIGDDIFLAPDACEVHVRVHRNQEDQSSHHSYFMIHNSPIAVLGFTTWDPGLTITPAMRWLEETGWQFGYTMLLPYQHAFIPSDMQHRFTYTSHISLPTEIARAHPFRENVQLYGWEDTLWGTELRDAGVKLFYEPDATALHYHQLDLKDSLARIEVMGKSLLHLTKVEPRMREHMPSGWKLWAYRILAWLPTMRGRHYRAFLRGLSD